MRKFRWQRWALMFLLVTRLVMGELGHAMPMEPAAMVAQHAMAVAESDPAECHDAQGGGNELPQTHDAGDSQNHAEHSSGEQDCCKTGDCECPCLHVPCAAFDAITLHSVTSAGLPISHGNEGVISQRPSRLFRPPA